MNHLAFKTRYLINATLTLQTGLHVGVGASSMSAADNAVIRLPDGRPYIPGSSLKGAFRSTVEKLAATIGAKSCGLSKDDEDCIGHQGAQQTAFNAIRKTANWNDEVFLGKLEDGLCDTCKLFGSNYHASRILFEDLLPIEGGVPSDRLIQVRDGVGIDRDSETAAHGIKYDYELVAPQQSFALRIWLEDPSPRDVQLTCLGLAEFMGEGGFLGGQRSRGLGSCKLVDVQIYCLDLSSEDVADRARRLRAYLLGKDLAAKMPPVPDANAFVQAQIEQLLVEVLHA